MKNTSKKAQNTGFALVVTLSLMILLTIIAVGLLTLSTISLRTSSQGAAQATANSNARLALIMAIGDLQKHLGPDQGISATSSSVNSGSSNPNVVGAWKSVGWQGPSGTPPQADDKAAQFRAWLVSARDPKSATNFGFAATAASSDSIWLANPDTTGVIAPNNTALRAERVPINVGNSNGGMAWIVSDNSTKAAINIESPEPSELTGDLVRNIANRTSAAAPRTDVLDSAFATIANPNDPQYTGPDKIFSLQTAALAIGKDNSMQVNARSQALTTASLGLLTNPVSGGLKTDLTPLLEGNSDLSAVLGATGPYFPTGDNGAPSWNFLRSHYQLYKDVSKLSSGKPEYEPDNLDPGRNGKRINPSEATLLPVIAKLQIMFSLVSHHSHITERVQAFNSNGKPQGNTKHAVPHLVYDPVITLYNPYDVALNLAKLRIRVWDPPVGFQFQKHEKADAFGGRGTDPWYRPEFANGEFHGLGRFQIKNEKNPNARRVFTLYLRNKRSSGKPGGDIELLPGEVKVFSPYVENNWNWAMETGSGYNPRSFFDWNSDTNMGNRDTRTNNNKGVETIPGLNFNAGFQVDHLSYAGRPTDTLYTWEVGKANLGAGWLSMKLTDDVTVNARPQRCVADNSLPDFRVDIMAGDRDDVVDPNNPTDFSSDILRTFEFRMADVTAEMATSSDPSKPISRRFNNEQILQAPNDRTAGGKSPFAIFTMSAKTTLGSRDDSKAWVQNNIVTEGGMHDSRKIGNAAQSYDLRLDEVADFTSFPGVEYDDANERGYFGAKATSSDGVSIVPMYRVPVTPAASLGDWIAGNLITSSQAPRVNYPLGNSFANPIIPSNGIQATSPMQDGSQVLDHSYLMNAALWDSYYFSSATDSLGRGKSQVLSDFFTGGEEMLNSRLVPYIVGSDSPSAMASKFAGESDEAFAKEFAGNAMIEGAFNINSDSIDAWRSVLSSLRDAAVVGYAKANYPTLEKTAFVRAGLPVAGSADDPNPENSVNAEGQIRWAGFRALDDDQIKNLATLIVAEIRARGELDQAPSLSLGDFINRRLGSESDLHAQKGILQTAIDKSNINADFHAQDSNTIDGDSLADDRTKGLLNKSALDGKTGDGAAPMLTQGDLLTGLAPFITARGDTFTIRSYGEARDASGSNVVARSWCEATVQRIPSFVDPNNDPEALPADLTEMNRSFGRRFVVTSFRWLNASEI